MEYLEIIQKNSNLLLQLINDILETLLMNITYQGAFSTCLLYTSHILRYNYIYV